MPKKCPKPQINFNKILQPAWIFTTLNFFWRHCLPQRMPKRYPNSQTKFYKILAASLNFDKFRFHSETKAAQIWEYICIFNQISLPQKMPKRCPKPQKKLLQNFNNFRFHSDMRIYHFGFWILANSQEPSIKLHMSTE